MKAPERVLADVRRRLSEHIELPGVLDVVELVVHTVLVLPLAAELELR